MGRVGAIGVTKGNNYDMLDKWTVEQREAYVGARATGSSRQVAHTRVLEEFAPEDPHQYRDDSLARIERKAPYKEMYANAQDGVRKAAVKHLYAHEGSRVHALNETAVKTVNALRSIEAPEAAHSKWQALSGTLVTCFREIREEIGPTRTASKENPLQKMIESLAKDPKGQKIVVALAEEAEAQERDKTEN